MNKTLEQIKDEYANEKGRDSWEEYFKWLDLCHTPHDVMQRHYDEIAQRYATEYAREAWIEEIEIVESVKKKGNERWD